MSSNNNQSSSAAAGIGIVGAAIACVALFLFAVAAFVTFILTILCFIACFKPLRFGNWTLTSDEAASFLMRGVAVMWLVPAFVFFSDVAFNLRVDWEYLPHMMCFGYVCGSLGWELVTAETSGAQPQTEVLPPAQRISHQSSKPQSSPWQRQETEPFGYASWDDEEELRR